MSSKRRLVPVAAVLLFIFIVSISMYRTPNIPSEYIPKWSSEHTVTTKPSNPQHKAGAEVMAKEPVANPMHPTSDTSTDVHPVTPEKSTPDKSTTDKTSSTSDNGHPAFSSMSRVTKSIAETHREIYSVSTGSGLYFPIKFGGYKGINPNIIPHPKKPNSWYIVSQADKRGPDNEAIWFTQLVCLAKFTKDGSTLACEREPMILPIPLSTTDKCVDDLAFFNFNIGPHDARVFYGPDRPYIVYGTQAKHHCFGQFIQDFRFLVEWPDLRLEGIPDLYDFPTDIIRPPPYLVVEKNWFIFWDNHNNTYVHYDIGNDGRGYSKLLPDGTTEANIAPAAAEHDKTCWTKYTNSLHSTMPKDIHQATNSLAITLCKRADPSCRRTDDNTVIMEIFHRKSFDNWHGRYEPFIMLFKQTYPFQLHGVSTKPLWLHGRKDWVEEDAIKEGVIYDMVKDQTEMVYVTSLSWKAVGQTYYGYLDDVMFLGFGVEDRDTAGIDVLASDLLQDILEC